MGITVSAVIFAPGHWLRPRHFGVWLWAMWEGVLFGVLLVATGSLLVPMIAHGLHAVTAYRVFAALIRKNKQWTGDLLSWQAAAAFSDGHHEPSSGRRAMT